MEAAVQTREFRRADFKRLCIVLDGSRPGLRRGSLPIHLLFQRFQTYLRMKRMLTCRLALLSVTGNGKDIEG